MLVADVKILAAAALKKVTSGVAAGSDPALSGLMGELTNTTGRAARTLQAAKPMVQRVHTELAPQMSPRLRESLGRTGSTIQEQIGQLRSGYGTSWQGGGESIGGAVALDIFARSGGASGKFAHDSVRAAADFAGSAARRADELSRARGGYGEGLLTRRAHKAITKNLDPQMIEHHAARTLVRGALDSGADLPKSVVTRLKAVDELATLPKERGATQAARDQPLTEESVRIANELRAIASSLKAT